MEHNQAVVAAGTVRWVALGRGGPGQDPRLSGPTEDPGRMITMARYDGRELVLESPALVAEYAAFLRGQRVHAADAR